MSLHNDADSNVMEWAVSFAKKHLVRTLKSNMEESPFDFVVATHPYASTILSELFTFIGSNIPVFYYATDVFNAPVASISNKLKAFFIPTEEGKEKVIALGEDESLVRLSAFPLQQEIKERTNLSKTEAREKLDLDKNLFTIQLNLGGEGIGSIKLISKLNELNLPCQIVILGGMSTKAKKKMEKLKNRLSSNIKLEVRGFVNNVGDYLDASDVVVGRAGINTIVEAIYAKRPFMITELVYTVIPSADYVEKYKVGWNVTDDDNKAIAILEDLIRNPNKLDEIEKNFSSVPIVFSSEKLARNILDEIEK